MKMHGSMVETTDFGTRGGYVYVEFAHLYQALQAISIERALHSVAVTSLQFTSLF